MSVTKERADSGQDAADPGEDSPSWCRFVPWAVFLLTFCAFLPAVNQGFVSWDDNFNFIHDDAGAPATRWRGLSEENVDWMFEESHIGHWQPLTWVSLALDWEIAGGDVPAASTSYEELKPVAAQIHRVSLLLHALSAVLVFFVLRHLLRRTQIGQAASAARLQLIAGAGALLFGVHPLRVESVAWATERRDVLAGIFLFATLLVWLRGTARGPRVSFGVLLLSCALFSASLLSKAWGITFPAVLLILDVWPLRRWKGLAPESAPLGRSLGALLLEKLPFAVLAAAAAWFALDAQSAGAHGATAVMSLDDHGVVQRLVQAAYGSVFYVRKTLWPTDLSPLYELEPDFDPTRAHYVISAAVFVLLTLVALLVRKRAPGVPFAWLTFLVVVSPVLGLVQSGAQVAADRYTYLACVPFAGLACAGLLYANGTRFARPALGLVAVALGVSLIATWQQTRVWETSETLWKHVAHVQPASYIAHHNLGQEYLSGRRNEEAIESFRRSVEAFPGEGNVSARRTLGNLLLSQGKRQEVEELYLAGLAVDPETWYLIQDLERLWGANSFERVDALWRAAADVVFQRTAAGRAKSNDWGVHYEYGQFLARNGRRQEAVRSWRAATQIAGNIPGLEALWGQIGQAELALGQLSEAEAALRQALALAERAQIWRADFELDLADCLRRTGRAAEARVIAQSVLRRQPADANLRSRAQNLAR